MLAQISQQLASIAPHFHRYEHPSGRLLVDRTGLHSVCGAFRDSHSTVGSIPYEGVPAIRPLLK
jgi:hypothetical protein